ncbi:hypothetical protein RRG08_058441 [Elysia crispata]|uniref:Uncharacterized protein n=1 Tax=Elysia crispata TaxID=231223 RepID=A0AAE1CQ87_9GAST|nr:hypothetical protein RRG08_058441 [Elysia crispata]
MNQALEQPGTLSGKRHQHRLFTKEELLEQIFDSEEDEREFDEEYLFSSESDEIDVNQFNVHLKKDRDGIAQLETREFDISAYVSPPPPSPEQSPACFTVPQAQLEDHFTATVPEATAK